MTFFLTSWYDLLKITDFYWYSQKRDRPMDRQTIFRDRRMHIQVSSEYKMRRRIFEPPPPTAQTEQARNLKFGMVGP